MKISIFIHKFILRGLCPIGHKPRTPSGDGVSFGAPRAPLWSPTAYLARAGVVLRYKNTSWLATSTFILFLVNVYANSFAAADVKTDATKTVTVQTKAFSTVLYFNGIIKPLKITNVVAPVDAAIVKMSFEFGQKVTKGQALVELNSNKLEQDYDSALTGYLKAKEDYNTTVAKYKATETLWNLKIIPQDELVSARSSLNTSHISYLQATYALEAQIKKTPTISEDVKKLRLSDFKKVDKALTMHYNNLEVYANASGVALPPPKSSGGSSGQSSEIDVGSNVKLGQLITKIGDLDGVSVDISVNEIDINKIQLKQKVFITGVAYPGITLTGYVDSIDSQASTDSGASGGLPTFAVKVVVPKLTADAEKVIRMGMTAKVELQISQPQKIILPITAVYKKDNKFFVNVLVNGKAEPRAVTTAQTTIKHVEITSGLTNGDKVISDATSGH